MTVQCFCFLFNERAPCIIEKVDERMMHPRTNDSLFAYLRVGEVLDHLRSGETSSKHANIILAAGANPGWEHQGTQGGHQGKERNKKEIFH